MRKKNRKLENRKAWRIWKPRICLTAEHYNDDDDNEIYKLKLMSREKENSSLKFVSKPK